MFWNDWTVQNTCFLIFYFAFPELNTLTNSIQPTNDSTKSIWQHTINRSKIKSIRYRLQWKQNNVIYQNKRKHWEASAASCLKDHTVKHILNTKGLYRGTINLIWWKVFHMIQKGLPYLVNLFLNQYVIFSWGIQLLISESHVPTGTGASDFHFDTIPFLAMTSKISVSPAPYSMLILKVSVSKVTLWTNLQIQWKYNTMYTGYCIRCHLPPSKDIKIPSSQ